MRCPRPNIYAHEHDPNGRFTLASVVKTFICWDPLVNIHCAQWRWQAQRISTRPLNSLLIYILLFICGLTLIDEYGGAHFYAGRTPIQLFASDEIDQITDKKFL
jgi:hypothetical protein